MARANPHPAPPWEVLVEFLHALEQTMTPYDWIDPLLRGSILMKHWFGAAARPAADIDLEWFPTPGRTESPEMVLEQARRLCMCAITNHQNSPIEFDDILPVPSDGINLWLWDYSTPGIRCYTGWRWAEHKLSGMLQIDIAHAGAYDFADTAPEPIELPRAWGDPARPLGYAPEMLLAAKLSWIVRHLQPNAFVGEAKDLFDAHLLLTQGRLRPAVFQNALLAVVMEDKLDLNQFDALLDEERMLADDGFPNWAGFAPGSPARMLHAVSTRLRPLMGELVRHAPFLRSAQAGPIDEADLLIYADWLEEHADPRATFLRLFCRFFFQESRTVREELAALFAAQSSAWLYHVFGGPQRVRELRNRIESP